MSGGTIVKTAGYPVLGRTGLYRVILDIQRDTLKSADIRLQLRAGARALSEYVHYPLGV